jgi:hypothetical protein
MNTSFGSEGTNVAQQAGDCGSAGLNPSHVALLRHSSDAQRFGIVSQGFTENGISGDLD